MWGKWTCVLAAIFIGAATLAAPVQAASPPQRCGGPSKTAQAGRMTLSPGLSARALKQTLTTEIHFYSCAPSGATSGSALLRNTYNTQAAHTCGLVKTPHYFSAWMAIAWKNGETSTAFMTFAFSGATRLLKVSGTISAGLFLNRHVTGQYKYVPTENPHGNSFATACANTKRVAFGRISVQGLNLFRNAPLIVN